MEMITTLFTGLALNQTQPVPTRLDPIDELKYAASPIRIHYTPRLMKINVPFMDFTKANRRWVDILLTELKDIANLYQIDKAIMYSQSSAKKGNGKSQTWQDFIDDLVNDKVVAKMDFSEGQLKHLPKLIDALSKGTRMAGCGSLEFYDVVNGLVL